MPFKSKSQRKWMHANKPKMAKKWEKEMKDNKPSQKSKPKPKGTAKRLPPYSRKGGK